MQRHQHQIKRKDVHFAGPSPQHGVAVLEQLRIEECGHGVDLWERPCLVLAALAQQTHVEVYDFVVEPVQAAQCLYVLAAYRYAEHVYQDLILWRVD